jgi:hypothetical protein
MPKNRWTKDNRLLKAYSEGQRGYPSGQNPHKPDTPAFFAWADGANDAGQKPEAAKVHGDVLDSKGEEEGKGKVPVKRSRKRVQKEA